MTALPVTDPEEELAIRIWAKLWKQGLSTQAIAGKLKIPESEIYNRIGRVKLLARKLKNPVDVGASPGMEDSKSNRDTHGQLALAARSGG